MSYSLDANAAKAADSIATSIKETGKYIGVITRAEALLSTNGTKGLGLSFKADNGATADYLDIYTHKKDGEALFGAKTVNALLACLKLRTIKDGHIKCEKWNKNAGRREAVEVPGYPDLMGKRIGLLLQQVLETREDTGADVEKLAVFAVFSPDTELTASEILEGKTNPARLSQMLDALTARPVRDNRKSKSTPRPASGGAAPTGTGFDDFEDSIPFALSLNDFDVLSPKTRRLRRAGY